MWSHSFCKEHFKNTYSDCRVNIADFSVPAQISFGFPSSSQLSTLNCPLWRDQHRFLRIKYRRIRMLIFKRAKFLRRVKVGLMMAVSSVREWLPAQLELFDVQWFNGNLQRKVSSGFLSCHVGSIMIISDLALRLQGIVVRGLWRICKKCCSSLSSLLQSIVLSATCSNTHRYQFESAKHLETTSVIIVEL